MYRVCLYLITGWSGFYVMGLELLGGRLLAPFFGSGIYVWGALIAVFMLALSVGYLFGGRASLARASLRRLALILMLGALSAIPIMLVGDALLERLSVLVPDPRFGSLLSAGMLFFLPTAVSGMVSPYAVRLLVADAHSAGDRAGRLYFVSTFGSAAGTLLTSFYAVLYLEVDQILMLFTGISFTVGAAAWLLSPADEA